MGIFQWLMKKVSKAFGRNTSSLFYSLLYREILKEVNDITKNEEISISVIREIGEQAGTESCERHSAIFKFMPGSPDKVISYFELLWVVVFGKELEELDYEEIDNKNSKYNDYILKINHCPICASYGTCAEDIFNLSKLGKESEGMASGLCGMLQGVANFILKIKQNDYRISITEKKCIGKSDKCLQLLCKIYDFNEWKELRILKAKDKTLSKIISVSEVEESEIVQKNKLDLIDQIQDSFSLDKLEELIDEPLENIKKKVGTIIKDKLNMEPDHFFDYFRNYEEDMIRIIGFLSIHILNENGRFIEKLLKNETIGKAIGYLFKQLKDMVLLFIPLDVVKDYHNLLINFLDGLAPNKMVENIKNYSGRDDINFLFEGAQMALEDLGINFSTLKENVWEELKENKENGLLSEADQNLINKTQENFPKIIQLFQEIGLLISEILTLPIRISISKSHYGLKAAINSVISEEEGLIGSIKNRFDIIFDNIQALRE